MIGVRVQEGKGGRGNKTVIRHLFSNINIVSHPSKIRPIPGACAFPF